VIEACLGQEMNDDEVRAMLHEGASSGR